MVHGPSGNVDLIDFSEHASLNSDAQNKATSPDGRVTASSDTCPPERLAEWASLLQEAQTFQMEFRRACSHFHFIFTSLPGAAFACHPPSCPLKVQHALRMMGHVYNNTRSEWRQSCSTPVYDFACTASETGYYDTRHLNEKRSAMEHHNQATVDKLRRYDKFRLNKSVSGELPWVPSSHWPDWEVVYGFAAILEEYFREHILPAPDDYLPGPLPPGYPEVESLGRLSCGMLLICLRDPLTHVSFSELASYCSRSSLTFGLDFEYYRPFLQKEWCWWLSNLWTSMEPLHRAHSRMAAFLNKRHEFLQRLESLLQHEHGTRHKIACRHSSASYCTDAARGNSCKCFLRSIELVLEPFRNSLNLNNQVALLCSYHCAASINQCLPPNFC